MKPETLLATVLLAASITVAAILAGALIQEWRTDKADKTIPLSDHDYIVEKRDYFTCFYKKITEKYKDNTILYYYCINNKYIN